jgi:arabinogalactan endo-1,4-beta-galactosidase
VGVVFALNLAEDAALDLEDVDIDVYRVRLYVEGVDESGNQIGAAYVDARAV